VKLKEIIPRRLISVTPDRTIAEAAKVMVENNIGLVVIRDQDHGRLRGVVSERDIIRSIAGGAGASGSIEGISTREIVTVRWDSEVSEAAKAMNKHRIRHVVIVDDADIPIGVISMRDLVGERSTLNAILESNDKEVFVGGD